MAESAAVVVRHFYDHFMLPIAPVRVSPLTPQFQPCYISLWSTIHAESPLHLAMGFTEPVRDVFLILLVSLEKH